MNNKTKKTDVEIYNFELAQMLNKETTILESECVYFENRKYDDVNLQYFDYYSDDKDFLNKFLENVTNKTISLQQIEVTENGEYHFEDCIKKLVEKKIFD